MAPFPYRERGHFLRWSSEGVVRQREKTEKVQAVEPGRMESESVASPAVAAKDVINKAQAIRRQTTTAIRAMRPP